MSEPDGYDLLARMIGTWDVMADMGDTATAMGSFTAKRVLDGNFILKDGYVKTSDGSNDFEILSMMAYDDEKDIYRIWSFLSSGIASETEGTWDPDTQILKQVTGYGEFTQTTNSDLSEDGIDRWTAISTDQDGNVVSKITGTNTRR